MSDQSNEMATMPVAKLREWVESLPHEELVSSFVSYVLAYQRERDLEAPSFGPLGDLSALSFGQLIERLKGQLRHPELSRFRVQGEEVIYITDSGLEVGITATGVSRRGEQAAGGDIGPQAGATAPGELPEEQPPDPEMLAEQPRRPAPSRENWMFGGGGAPRRAAGPPARRPSTPRAESPTSKSEDDSGSKEGGDDKSKSSLLEF